MRQNEWKLIQSQPTAISPIPLQGFGHPKKCYPGDDKEGIAREGLGIFEIPHIQRAPEAFCIIQQRADALRAGVHSWKTAQTISSPTAPYSDSQVQLIKKKPCICTSYPLPRPPSLSFPSVVAHFSAAQSAFVSISPWFQCNPSLCFPSTIWNDKFLEELYHTST